MKNILFSIIAMYISFTLVTIAQEVVVNEYNAAGGNPSAEFCELLITQDNVSLVGYSIRDNSDAVGWMGGLRFKDVPLWKNLRRGTIIIVDYRDAQYIDENADDGFIEAGGNNTLLFDQFLDGASDWTSQCLNINATNDCVQIRNSANVHVHAFAHLSGANADIQGLPTPKTIFTSSIANSGLANMASSLADYDSFGGPQLKKGIASKGLPNTNTSYLTQNQMYWRSLRQLDMNPASNISVTASKDKVILNWSSSSSSLDTALGYLLLRLPSNLQSQKTTPEDSKIYKVGDVINGAEVIANIPKLSTLSYTEIKSIDCGVSYIYRLFVYKFNPDDLKQDISPATARGRAYNEDAYVDSPVFERKLPPIPAITTANGKIDFCQGDETNLNSDITDLSKYDFQWINDDDISFSATSTNVKINKSGKYHLKLTDKISGCETVSNLMAITFLAKFEAFIQDSKNYVFKKDTTIELCPNEKLQLSGYQNGPPSGYSFQWLKDNIIVAKDKTVYEVASEGVYTFVVLNNNMCPGTSVKITVKYINQDFTITPNTLSIDLNTSQKLTFTINNNSNKDILLDKNSLVFSPPQPDLTYIITSPLPDSKGKYLIQALSPVVFEITMSATNNGTWDDTLTIKDICGNSQKLKLHVDYQDIGDTKLFVSPQKIDFIIQPLFCDSKLEGEIILVPIGTKDATIFKPTLIKTDFQIIDTINFKSPKTFEVLKPKDTLRFKVSVTTLVPGVFNDILTINYQIDGKDLSKVIPLSVELFEPKIDFKYTTIDLSNKPVCNPSIDTFLVVTNNTKMDYVISKQPLNTAVHIIDLEKQDIKVLMGKTIQIPVTITMTSPFTDTLLAIINYGPCTLQSPPLKFIQPQNAVSIPFKDDSISLGKINNCKFPNNYTYTYTLKVSGNNLKIKEIKHNGNIRLYLNLKQGDLLKNGDNLISVVYEPGDNSLLVDSTMFVIDPCDIEFKLKYSAERFGASAPSFTANLIDFGTDGLGVNDVKSYTISNPNSVPMNIDNISIKSPFVLVPAPNYPIIIPPKDKVVLSIRYDRNVESKFRDSMNITITDPCDFSFKVDLLGEAVDNKIYELKFVLPPKITSEPSKLETIRVKIEAGINSNLKNAAIDSIDIYLNYNSSLIFPKSIVAKSSGIKTAINSETRVKLIGTTQLHLVIDDPKTISNNEFVDFNILALLGNKLTTDLTIDTNKTQIFAQKKTKFTVEDGNLEINGICQIGNRLLEVGSNSQIMIVQNGSDNYTAKFNNIIDDFTIIEIYNTNGELILPLLNEYMKNGTYEINFSTNRLAVGAYFVVMKSGTIIETEKFILNK